MPKVEYTSENNDECLCPGCPVQGDSACVRERMERAMQGEGALPAPEDAIAVYCAIGAGTCGGLDGLRECICPDCAVWETRELNGRWYCLAGGADEVDIPTT